MQESPQALPVWQTRQQDPVGDVLHTAMSSGVAMIAWRKNLMLHAIIFIRDYLTNRGETDLLLRKPITESQPNDQLAPLHIFSRILWGRFPAKREFLERTPGQVGPHRRGQIRGQRLSGISAIGRRAIRSMKAYVYTLTSLPPDRTSNK